jgi:hypothetical protein
MATSATDVKELNILNSIVPQEVSNGEIQENQRENIWYNRPAW